MKYYPRFHRIEKAFIVIVAEGEGTKESVIREVKYVFNENFVPMGIIDPEKESLNDK